MLLCVFVTSILHLVQKKNLLLKGLGMLMNDQVCLNYLHEHPKIIMIFYQSMVITFLFVWVLNPTTRLSIFGCCCCCSSSGLVARENFVLLYNFLV